MVGYIGPQHAAKCCPWDQKMTWWCRYCHLGVTAHFGLRGRPPTRSDICALTGQSMPSTSVIDMGLMNYTAGAPSGAANTTTGDIYLESDRSWIFALSFPGGAIGGIEHLPDLCAPFRPSTWVGGPAGSRILHGATNVAVSWPDMCRNGGFGQSQVGSERRGWRAARAGGAHPRPPY